MVHKLSGSSGQPSRKYSKWIRDINVKNDIFKVVKENLGEVFYNLSIGKGFLPMTQNPGAIIYLTTKNSLCKSKNLRHGKDHHKQSQKTTAKLGESVCNLYLRGKKDKYIYRKS